MERRGERVTDRALVIESPGVAAVRPVPPNDGPVADRDDVLRDFHRHRAELPTGHQPGPEQRVDPSSGCSARTCPEPGTR